MKLEPVDILVDVNEKKDLYSQVERWALGNPYIHVRMFYGKPYPSMPPLFYESIPTRGVTFTNVYDSLGQMVVVMRLRPEYDSFKQLILHNALEIATDPQSKYDFECVPGYILLRLICGKLGIPLPLRYHRNEFMVCSEACAEPFWRSGLEVLSQDVVPLPGDFVCALVYFQYIATGPIAEDWV